jgi:hypothetical protein
MAAPLGFKTFATGDVLTAADTNGYLMQGVWTFANAAARDAAVTSPQEGNMCFLKDTDAVQYYSGSAWTAVGGAGGGLTLLSTTSLSGATPTISSIVQTYKSLRMVIYGVTNATANGVFRIAPNANTTGSSYVSTDSVGASFVNSVNRVTYLNLGTTAWSRTATNNVATVQIDNYTSSTNYKSISAYGYAEETGGSVMSFNIGGAFVSNTAITSLQFSNAGGNLSTGTVLLYGVN